MKDVAQMVFVGSFFGVEINVRANDAIDSTITYEVNAGDTHFQKR